MERLQYSHGAGGKAPVRERRRGHWSFQPSLTATLATALLVPLLLALGHWQLQRAEQKDAWQAQRMAQAALPPVQASPGDLPGLGKAAGRRVVVHGHWDVRRQVLLDNQTSGGQAGYLVFTALRGEDGRAVLVNRGWLTGGPRRDMAPNVHIESGAALVEGIVAPPPSPGLLARQGVDTSLGDELLRVQHLDIEELSQRLGLDLQPLTLLLAPGAPDGYLRQWQLPRLAPERHRAYALQWFLFAALLAGLYLGLNLRR